MSVAIILPARLASTRLPNKLLLDRTGKTLLEHTIERAQLAQKQYPKLFTTIRVACDDETLVAAAKRTGVQAVMTRKDHESGTDRIAEAAHDLKEEIIVNLQADEPEIDPYLILTVASGLTQPAGHHAEIATVAVRIIESHELHNPNIVKIVTTMYPDGERALYFSRAPIPYARDGANAPYARFPPDASGHPVLGLHHIGIYAYRRDALMRLVKFEPSSLEKLERLEQLRALQNGFTIRVLIPFCEHAPGIDTPEDYKAFVARQREKK